MYCPQCRQELPDFAQFCANCGTPIPSGVLNTSSQQPITPSQQPAQQFTPSQKPAQQFMPPQQPTPSFPPVQQPTANQNKGLSLRGLRITAIVFGVTAILTIILTIAIYEA